MSKIAKKKSLEAYPPTPLNVSLVDYNSFKRTFYAEGYDQAMQDFLEKAEEFLYLQLNNGSIECGNIENLIKQLKNYMEDEL